jgi:tetratricopeptide (TPR) repeat protein
MRMSIRCYLGMVGPRGKIVPLIVFVLFFSLPAAGRAQSSANPFREDSASIAKPTPSEIQRLARAAKATPESASARLDFGAALAESDQWQLALEQFEIALKANPENAETIYDIGLTHLMIALNARDHHSKSYDGELDQAQQALLRALGINPNLPRIHEHLGWLYHQIGDQDSAIEQFRKEVELNPSSAEALNNLGTALAQAEKYPEAVKCYEDALALDVTCAACLLNLESAIRWQGNTEIALKTYEARVQSQRNSPLAHLLYGMILTVAKNHRDAAMAELNSALALTPRLAAAHYYLGQIQYENRNETAAEAEYRIAIKLDPNRPEFLGPLATILIQENKMPEARVILEKSLSLDPANSSAHYKLSLILQRAGEKEKAATERAETARLQQQDLEQSKLALNLKRGIADLRAGDAQDAVRELQTAIQFDPNHPETNFYLGIALSQTGDSAASSQAFRKALEFRPESAEIHYNFGIALWRSGQTALAIAELRRTTEIRPEDAKAHCALGIALLRTGDSAEGQHEIEHAQHLGACEQQPQ